MKIEVLYGELCNLFGDAFNIKYLEKCLPNATFIYTGIEDVPLFTKEHVDLVYMGPMSENTQELVISKLSKYKKELKENIKNNINFLITGNAIEVFGSYIENEDGSKIECLGLYDIYAKRQMMKRFNAFTIGTFNDIEVVGFKSQFTQMYGNNDKYFLDVIRGCGINPDSNKEGIKDHNFIATYLLGPILVLNPLFTKYLLKQMGSQNLDLIFEKESLLAYQQRVEEFKDTKRNLN